MDLPSVAQLCAAIPRTLFPLKNQTAPLSAEVSAVHVSDLADPTPFLSGNELLLITGLSLPRTPDGVADFVERLLAVPISGLGVGLGPTLESVPTALEDAAADAGLPLLVVPPEGAFLDVTKAYWSLRSATEQRELTEAVTAHGELVRAAFASAPVPAMLRALAQSLPGWAAMVSPTGDLQDVFPAGRIQDALAVATRLEDRLAAGLHPPHPGAKPTDNSMSYPVTLGNRTVAFLLIGTDHRLSVTKHRVGLAAAALLAFSTLRRQEQKNRAQGQGQAIATLIDLRMVESAGRLASRLDLPLPNEVRVVVADSSMPPAVERTILEWSSDTLVGSSESRPSWYVVPAEGPDANVLGSMILEVDPVASVVISDAVSLDRVHDVRLSLNRVMADLPVGSIQVQEKRVLQTTGLDQALARLQQYSRADLVGTLVAYLRHRGQWEDTARALQLHRNTVRHRIARARDVLRVDIDDPDVAAELWLLLRRNGLA